MRWHSLMIKWSLYLRHCFSSCYETLIHSSVLTLPSQRTLREYTYAVDAHVGYTNKGDQQLMEAANVLTCKEYQRNVIVTIDELYIKEGLDYEKHTGALICFANIGGINQHLLQFEKAMTSNSSSEHFLLLEDIAKSMLVIMVQGLFTNLNYPYAQFPCASLTGKELFDQFWKVGAVSVYMLAIISLFILMLSCMHTCKISI